MTAKRTVWSLASLLLVLALVLGACAPAQPAAEPTAAPAPAPAQEQPATPTEAPVAEVPTSYLERAKAGEFAGTAVSVLGVMVDEEQVKFEASMKPFEDATGIDVQYEGTKEFEPQVTIRIQANDPPDVINFPQPGFLANFVRQGKVVDVSTFLDMEKLQDNYIQSWLDMATMPGADGQDIMAGVWHRAAAKSMVWYPKKAFDAAGYTVPTTWDELLAVTEEIAADGDPAWCIGIESGAATGWVATDWIENIMLRTTALENYDAWVAGELPFASPEVKNAADVMSGIWLNDQYVKGGKDAIVSTFIGDSPVSMFTDPPQCWFHVQASWITGFFGEGLTAGEDYDFFYLPPIDEAYGKPVLVAGDIMAMFNDRPEVRALMEYFSTGQSVEAWIRSGGTLSPHKDASLDWYSDTIERKVAELLQNATSVRFDASDLMPGEVGAGSFWKGMVDYVNGSVDLDAALQEIDASWPR
jgi:alpha-glucoside transport system substrate-binding protein